MKTKVLSFRMLEKEIDLVKEIADNKALTVTEFIRFALREYMDYECYLRLNQEEQSGA